MSSKNPKKDNSEDDLLEIVRLRCASSEPGAQSVVGKDAKKDQVKDKAKRSYMSYLDDGSLTDQGTELQRSQGRVVLPGAFCETPSSELTVGVVRSDSNCNPAAATSMPEATPLSAEVAQDHESTALKLQELEAKANELEAKNQEIERLKRNLQALNQQIHVAAPVEAVDVSASTSSNNQHRLSRAQDIATELESLVLDPADLQRSASSSGAPKTTLTTPTLGQLCFSSLGLVGRNAEKEVLASCLQRATAKGTRELVLIHGYSGTGKTALASTLAESKAGGLYVAGKFDLYLRDEPYAGVASACRDLCQRLGSVPEICQEMVAKLGVDLNLLVRILPELQSLIAQAADSSATAGEDNNMAHSQGLDESKKKIAHAFRRFFRVVCSFFPSLVLSLDDLQWADVASLDLLESLLTDDQISSLVVVGCYRSNEVGEAHLVSKTIRELEAQTDATGLQITKVPIGNLGLESVHEMLRELLSMSASETMALAQVCHKKTLGNAFFAIQFVAHLQDKGLLQYSWKLRKWTWDVPSITSQTSSTSNVVDLLKEKMQHLPPNVVQLLPILACMGSSVEESTLLVVWIAWCKHNNHDTPMEPLLAAAVELGFLEKHQSAYRFVHDKIQEAAMALVDPKRLEGLKSTIGNIFVTEFSGSELEPSLFVAINLLNEGTMPTLIGDHLELAELNLRAAKKAVVASAFASAAKYALRGIGLLPPTKWEDQYNLTLELFSLASEVQGYLGRYESMKAHCDEVLAYAEDLADTFRVHNCLQDSYLIRHLNQEALDHGLDLLKRLGHKFPKGQGSMAMATISGILKTKLSINSRIGERIDALPAVTDPVKIQVIHTLDKCCTAAFLLMHDIFALLVFKIVQLTLKHGVSQYSPVAFTLTACILAGGLNDFESASRLVDSVEKMMEKSRNTASRTAFVLNCTVLPWLDPSRNCLKKLVNGYHDGLSTGDTDSAMWCMNVYIGLGFQSGRSLPLLEADCGIYLKQMREFERVKIAKYTEMYQNAMGNLTGNVGPSSTDLMQPHLIGLEEEVYNNDEIMGDLTLLFHNRLYAIFGDHSTGADLSIERGDRYLKGAPGSFHHIPDAFHRALSSYTMGRQTRKRKYIQHAQKHHSRIKLWTKKGCPNTIHYKHILDAENAVLKKQQEKARDLYRKATVAASEAGFIQDAALACERYGDYLLTVLDDKESASVQLGKAKRFYSDWGAIRKVEMMQKKYNDVWGSRLDMS